MAEEDYIWQSDDESESVNENDYIWQSDSSEDCIDDDPIDCYVPESEDDKPRKRPKRGPLKRRATAKRPRKTNKKAENVKKGSSPKIQEATSTSKAQNVDGKANPEKVQSKNKIQDFPGLTEIGVGRDGFLPRRDEKF